MYQKQQGVYVKVGLLPYQVVKCPTEGILPEIHGYNVYVIPGRHDKWIEIQDKPRKFHRRPWRKYHLHALNSYLEWKHATPIRVNTLDQAAIQLNGEDNLLIKWVPERKEWVAIEDALKIVKRRGERTLTHNYFGPFMMDDMCLEKLMDAYGIRIDDMSLKIKIPTTPP